MQHPPITWSAFQSVFQLAVALNIGFTALLTIFGKSAAREKRLIDRCLDLTRTFKNEASQMAERAVAGNDNAKIDVIFDLADSANNFYLQSLNLQYDFHEHFESSVLEKNNYWRLACIVSSVISLIMLLWSSVQNEEIGPAFEVLGIILLSPVFLYVGIAGWQSWQITRLFEAKRSSLEKQARDGLLSLNRKGNPHAVAKP